MPNGKIRFAALYGAGRRLGYTPQQVDAMSLFQWMSLVVDAENESAQSDGHLTPAETDDLWDWMQTKGNA